MTTACKCGSWKRDRSGYERRCRIGRQTILASLSVWGGDVTVSLIDSAASETPTQRFPHTGPVCRIDEAKAYADEWLKLHCAGGRR